jgi:hypothetical protein
VSYARVIVSHPAYARALNDDIPGLDGDLDPLGDFEQFLRVAAARLSVQFVHFEFCDALVRA